MPGPSHIFISFDAESGTFGVPVSQVQEVIRLDGPFDAVEADKPTVAIRQRTVQMIDVESWLGISPTAPDHLVVFERNHRLHAIPVKRADRGPVRSYRELDLREARPKRSKP